MSEHEKREQIGKLAEEYSEAKGKLNHIQEKLNRAQRDFFIAGNQQTFSQLKVVNGVLFTIASQYTGNEQKALEDLLNSREIVEVLKEKERLATEVRRLAERLKALAPHLL